MTVRHSTFGSSPFDEYVNGTIIGGTEVPYEFWIDEPRPECVDRDGKRRVAKGNFETDSEAVAWFRENHPVEFAHGVEMRCWDL